MEDHGHPQKSEPAKERHHERMNDGWGSELSQKTLYGRVYTCIFINDRQMSYVTVTCPVDTDCDSLIGG